MDRFVDFHSHILPGIDDGSASLEESVSMLQQEAKQGIRCVVATPHFYAQHDMLEHFLMRRREASEKLLQSMEEHPELPSIVLGAEVYFFPGMSNCEELSELTIGNTGYMLLEMPPAPWTTKMYGELEEIRAKRDIIPIIAHVDRYLGLINTFGIPKQLEKMPVLVQANASFFLQKNTQARAIRMLEKDQIQLLGSDCHNMKNRPPKLGEAVQVISRNASASAIRRVWHYQEQVLGNPGQW